jgi:S-DNA-T family DNA segregation ATPase FtsK/SpoIIIE
MISAATRSNRPPLRLGISPEKADEIIGVLLACCGVILTASLVSYHPLDPSLMHRAPAAGTGVHNFIGPFGAQLSSLAFAFLGLISFLLPLLLAVAAFRRLTHRPRLEGLGRHVGFVLLLAVLPALTQLAFGRIRWQGEAIDIGGALGVVLAEFLVLQLHAVGAAVVLVAAALIGGNLAIRSTLGDAFRSAGQKSAEAWQGVQFRRARQEKKDNAEHRKQRILQLAQDQERERRDAAVAQQAPPRTPRVTPPRVEPAPPSTRFEQPPLRVTEKKGEARFSVRRVQASDTDASAGYIEKPAPVAAAVPAPMPVFKKVAASSERGEATMGAASAAHPTTPTVRPNSWSDLDLRSDLSRPGLADAALHAVPAATPSALTPILAPPPARVPASPAPVAPAPPARAAEALAALRASLPASPAAAPARPPAAPTMPAPRTAQQTDLGFDPEQLLPELPPVNLMNCESPERFTDEGELMRLGEKIHQSADHFGVEGVVEAINPGPVITVYEFRPAPGVKVSKVVNLQDDLALALKAESVRIDRMAGRSTLGIEVPNSRRSTIHLGQLLADERFKKAPSVLTMALGVDIHGQPCYFDLATMPHLLVAGATGSGKSVGLQSMITSILYKATRDEVQFIFIDPKRIELGVYADIPHLKTEVVVEPKKAANALRWAVSEMERRYRLLAEVHVRSIDYYNRAIRDPRERERLSLKEGESEFKPEDFQPLPYYVIIIDELADLMMVSSSDVEASIARLAQMARAVGIHLIVATQRPSVDVLTGTIKANFPCRLAFATASRHDSRTILDQIGSEKLLGKGDALFMPPGSSRIMRLHGAYISEQETAGLIRWLKRRGKPNYDPNVTKAPEGDEEGSGRGGSGGGPADDDLFEEAARMVVAERQASASFLQRRMRVGFSRAARLIDLLEADGLLGPAQGSKPREVLVPPDYFDEVDRHE